MNVQLVHCSCGREWMTESWTALASGPPGLVTTTWAGAIHCACGATLSLQATQMGTGDAGSDLRHMLARAVRDGASEEELVEMVRAALVADVMDG